MHILISLRNTCRVLSGEIIIIILYNGTQISRVRLSRLDRRQTPYYNICTMYNIILCGPGYSWMRKLITDFYYVYAVRAFIMYDIIIVNTCERI